jgi:multifunctional methyltransferase subunit TRM112
MCNRRQCTGGGFPLKLKVGSEELDQAKVKVEESEFNPEFIKHLVAHKLDWSALVEVCESLGEQGVEGVAGRLPPTLDLERDLEDDDLLKVLHEVLVELHVLEGGLTCPRCDREFPIKQGIPNMLLHDDEV